MGMTLVVLGRREKVGGAQCQGVLLNLLDGMLLVS
jgi:hypothetical protein